MLPSHRNAGTPQPVRIGSRTEAEQLMAGVLGIMTDLEGLLESETGLVRVGRFREGLAQQERKSEMAAAYILQLEAVKGNAVALARLAPEALDRLKKAHLSFGKAVQANQMVLATARAVSETLVKGIAEEMSRQARPRVYAPPGAAPRTATNTPLVLSRQL